MGSEYSLMYRISRLIELSSRNTIHCRVCPSSFGIEKNNVEDSQKLTRKVTKLCV